MDEQIKEGQSTLTLKKEQVKELFSALFGGLAETQEDNEWGSVSVNVTYGPNEAPVVCLLYLPGTTKDHAITIQNKFAESALSLNNGTK